ncbi:hypothetical protein [Asticcacaulis biprosthecium]|nr:hypothetical protein [Asticcacaulis biprosthecium]
MSLDDKMAQANAVADVLELPDGEYAIVEVMGHRTMIGRVAEVERFGAKFVGIEPVWTDKLLPQLLVGGASIYQLTPCSRETAQRRQAKYEYQLPPPVKETLPEEPPLLIEAQPDKPERPAHGLFDDEIAIIMRLGRDGKVQHKKLGPAVNELVERQYVMLQSSTPDDADTVMAVLTSKGQEAFERIDDLPF